MIDPTIRLLTADDLYKMGIHYVRQSLARLEKQGQFPRRVKLTPNGQVRWIQSEIQDWLKDRMNSRPGNLPASPPTVQGGRHVSAR